MNETTVAIDGERIVAYREFYRLSQAELAAKIGASVNTIQRWEKSGCKSSGAASRKLSELLSEWEVHKGRLEKWIGEQEVLNEIFELMPEGSTDIPSQFTSDDQWMEKAREWFTKLTPDVAGAFLLEASSLLTDRQRTIVAFFNKYQLQSAFKTHEYVIKTIRRELEIEEKLSAMLKQALAEMAALREQAEQVRSIRNEAAQELSDAIRLRREALQAYESAQLEIERFWKRRVADLEERLEEMEKRIQEKA